MSRDQQNQTFQTATEQNATEFADSQQAEQSAQDAIAKYVAQNPYAKGGEFETDENAKLSDTAEGSSDALRTQLQMQAQRTGQNMTAANATAEAGSEANERALASEQAGADQERIQASDARGTVPINAETAIAAQQGSQAGGTLGTQQKAGDTPSWLDEFGNAVAGGLGSAVTKGLG